MDAKHTGKIYGINGPVIYLKGRTGFKMSEMVYVGEERLVGEVISLDKDRTTIQVYEETSGLKPGEIVEGTGDAVSVILAPGIINNIFDGIERPLEKIAQASNGAFITRGVSVDSLDLDKLWDTHMTVAEGDALQGGAIIAEVPETHAIVHKCMVPPDVEGIVVSVVPDGPYHINDTLVVIETTEGERKELSMMQKWPIRVPRPVHHRYSARVPLVTGQRVMDTMFPLAKGGTAAIPGGFGTGKTMSQHQIAKWSDADIIVYIGCGERGNEMTQVLEEFSELVDPRTGNPLMDRTTLIANTSNMPVAAREASIYTGLTLAEYYRDMGYDVAIMADSTSRWAEALRELSGRLEEIPGEEAFPAYLESTIASFYERAGKVRLKNGKIASVTIGGTVSPAGGNFEEPVTQATLKVVGAFHGLSRERSDARKYPAIHPMDSWSKYDGVVDMTRVEEARSILHRGNEINQMMKVVGEEGTSAEDYIIYQKGELLDSVYLQQNSFDPIDAACSPDRQREEFGILYDALMASYDLDDKNEIRGFFNQLRQEFLDWHGTEFESPEFYAQEKKISEFYKSKAVE